MPRKVCNIAALARQAAVENGHRDTYLVATDRKGRTNWVRLDTPGGIEINVEIRRCRVVGYFADNEMRG